jgi:hypothetical protein
MTGDNFDRSRSVAARKRAARTDEPETPAAGPHAREELTDHDKTPGCGMLPDLNDTNPGPTG